MDSWLQFGVEASRWLQATYPQLEGLMALLTTLGLFEFYLAVMPLVYWCIDKRLGRYLTYLIALSDLLGNVLKHTIRGPRPFWLDPALQLNGTEGYGIPSNHVQTTAVLYLGLASYLRRRWFWPVAALMVFMMGLSRVYLGDHFVHDALAGLALGLLVLAGHWLFRRRLEKEFEKRILGQRLLLVTLVPLILIILYLVGQYLLPGPPEAVAWAEEALVAEDDSVQAIVSSFATLVGIGLGFTMEMSWVRFLVAGTWQQKTARYIIGMLGILVLWRGLGLAFDAIPIPILFIPLRLIRYLLLGLWASYYAPQLFVRLRLARAEPKPEITMSL